MRTEGIANRCARGTGTVLAVTLALSLAACSGGSAEDSDADIAADTPDDPAPTAPDPTPSPEPLTLDGAPAPSVAVGSQFRFRPLVRGAGVGAALTFTAANLPSWTSLDPTTGEVSGTPDSEDVGNYPGIVITVSEGGRSASLEAFALEVVAAPLGSAQLSWSAPTENADGTPLTDLAGFRVYWGAAEDELSYSMQIDNPSVSMYLVENLTPARWFFAVTAVDAAGHESVLSEVISGLIG